MATLSKMHCKPCMGGTPPLTEKEIEPLFKQLKGWHVVNHHHLEKKYRFKDFKGALKFTNHIGDIAEKEGHHPDILLSWGEVNVQIWTHKINGLTESDFILAAKCDEAENDWSSWN